FTLDTGPACGGSIYVLVTPCSTKAGGGKSGGVSDGAGHYYSTAGSIVLVGLRTDRTECIRVYGTFSYTSATGGLGHGSSLGHYRYCLHPSGDATTSA